MTLTHQTRGRRPDAETGRPSGFRTSTSLRPPGVQRKPCECEDDEPQIARFAECDDELTMVPSIVDEVSRSPGQPLNGAVRSRFEPAFHFSFADVRVHADDRAAVAADAVNARAFTTGEHIVFGRGEYDALDNPHLLAHELAHVVQQGRGPVQPGISGRGDAAELEAEHLAAEAVARPSTRAVAPSTQQPSGNASASEAVSTRGGSAVQRWPGDGMKPPGDCSWTNYMVLRGAVEAAKAIVQTLGGCTAKDDCHVLVGKIAAIAAEIAARVALDSSCFRGGDTGHRQQVQDKVAMLKTCHRQFVAKNCMQQLAAEAAAAVAAAEAAAAADAATAAQLEESAAASTELIEGAAATGEAVEGGVTLIEVFEIAAILL